MPQPADDQMLNIEDDLIIGAADTSYADNGNYYPKPPADQVAEIAETEGIKAASYPVLGSVAAWFEQQLINCNDITNVVTDSQTINGVTYSRQVSIEAQVLAYQILKGLLQDKFDEFKEYKFED